MSTRPAIAYLRPVAGQLEHLDLEGAADRRLDVIDVVRDTSGEERGRLGEVLNRLAEGEATTLLVGMLRAVAGSLRELVALVEWLDAVGADLVALDVDLDTTSSSGRRLVAVLREIERWEHEPGPGQRPRGRPGIAHREPELAERVAELRDRGLSLQAIADALNAEGVPTPRGGAEWRPSSVQAALGYRRPRLPAPGVPPPPPPGPPGPRRHPPPPGGGPPPPRGRR